MKSYFQIVSKYKIQRYWKMFAEKKEQIQNLYFYNWSEKWFRNALEKKACKYVVEYQQRSVVKKLFMEHRVTMVHDDCTPRAIIMI